MKMRFFFRTQTPLTGTKFDRKIFAVSFRRVVVNSLTTSGYPRVRVPCVDVCEGDVFVVVHVLPTSGYPLVRVVFDWVVVCEPAACPRGV